MFRAEVLERQGKQWLFVWDDSVVEKPESWYSQGLCPVGSSKSKRLQKVKPGKYFKTLYAPLDDRTGLPFQ